MELLQRHWKNLVRFVSQGLLLTGLSLLSVACVSTPVQDVDVNQVLEINQQESAVVETDKIAESMPLTPELIYYILTAEIAGQRGEMGAAVDLYHKAAELAESPLLAGRSAQVATYSRDQKRINRALTRWIEIDPTEADVYIMQAPLLIIQGDFDQVIKGIDTALALAPDESQTYLTRITDNLIELAKPKQALATIEQLQAFKDNNPEAVFAYARLNAFYKQYDQALVAVDAVLAQQPAREQALIIKAEILQRLGQGDNALKLLSKVAKKDDASDELRFAFAKSLAENGKIEQARTVFQQLYDENPDNDEVIFALGLLALDEKQGEVAKQYFSQLVKKGDPSKQAAYFMGLSEELNGDIDSALIWFDSVPAESQRFTAAQTRYINLLTEQGNVDKAQLHLKLLRKEHPERAVNLFIFEASFLRERGLDQAAFDLYSEALLEHPGNIELLYGRAMVAEPLNRLAVLEQDLRLIIKQDPNNSQALNALGYTLTDRTDRHQEAFVLITRALEIKPNDPFYLDSLGWVHFRLGHLAEAERYLRQAAEIQPDPEFLAHLGEVLWLRDKTAEAKAVWQQGLKQQPDNQFLLDTMHRFGQ